MDALINFSESTDHITLFMNDNEHKIKIVGTHENPYFCGKDVCEILGYIDIKQALQKHVKSKHKEDLKTINESKKVDVTATSTYLGLSHLKNLSYNESKAVYINEPGLYSLIMHSKTKFAESFQDLIYEKILPSIRKYGSYILEKEFEEKLNLKDEELQEHTKKLQEKDKELEEQKQRNLKMRDFVHNANIKEKNEWIYIAGTFQYASQNRFKVGSTRRLVKRLGPYNTGRAQEDQYHYFWLYKCHNATKTDDLIKTLLTSFQDKKNGEIYIMHFEDLVDIVQFICDNIERSIEYVNKFIKERLDKSLNKKPIVPEPIQIEKTKLTIQRVDNDEEEIIDLTNLSIEEKEKVIKEKLDLFSGEIYRDELMKNFQGKNKMEVWKEIKSAVKWKDSKTQIKGVGNELVIKYNNK